MKDSFLLVGRGELPEEVAFELHLEGLRLLGAGESAGIRRCRVVIESRSGGIRVTGFPMLAQLSTAVQPWVSHLNFLSFILP